MRFTSPFFAKEDPSTLTDRHFFLPKFTLFIYALHLTDQLSMSANTDYIIFLKLTEKLPFWYGRLARMLAEHDLTLVPMGLSDLKEMSLKHRVHVLCFNDSPVTHRLLANFRSRYLDFAMTRKKLVLYELSSFAPISKKFVFNGQEYYRHLSLPLPLAGVSKFVAGDYFLNWESESIWPGGKRARLPDQGQSR